MKTRFDPLPPAIPGPLPDDENPEIKNITLRDVFAMIASNAMFRDSDKPTLTTENIESWPRLSYEYADIMIFERNKKRHKEEGE